MKIKYEIDAYDLKKFQIHYLLNSKYVIISIGAIIIFTIANIGLMFTNLFDRYLSIIKVLYYVLIGLIMLYVVLRKIQNNSKNNLVFGEYELELKDGVLYYNKNGYSKKIRVNSYMRFAENKKYIYLFLTRSYANIIPKYKARPMKDLAGIIKYIEDNVSKKTKRKKWFKK